MRKTSRLYPTLSITIKYPGYCSSPVLGLVFITSVMKLFRKLFASGSASTVALQTRYRIVRFTLRLKQRPVQRKEIAMSLLANICKHYRFIMLLLIQWFGTLIYTCYSTNTLIQTISVCNMLLKIQHFRRPQQLFSSIAVTFC